METLGLAELECGDDPMQAVRMVLDAMEEAESAAPSARFATESHVFGMNMYESVELLS